MNIGIPIKLSGFIDSLIHFYGINQLEKKRFKNDMQGSI